MCDDIINPVATLDTILMNFIEEKATLLLEKIIIKFCTLFY